MKCSNPAIVITLALVLGIMAGALALVVRYRNRNLLGQLYLIQAYYLAEAGMNYALRELKDVDNETVPDPDYSGNGIIGDIQQINFPDPSDDKKWFRVELIAGTKYILTSTGHSHGFERILRDVWDPT